MLASALLLPTVLVADQQFRFNWLGWDAHWLFIDQHLAMLIRPRQVAAGAPWIWRTEFFGHEPQADLALLRAGWHVAYIRIPNLYGAPSAVAAMRLFHDEVVRRFGLSNRAVLEGFSRGGLYAVNFAAAYPERTAALYLDAPVLDIRSWPAGRGKGQGDARCWQELLTVYGMDETSALAFRGNPLDKAAALARAGIPVLIVAGDADRQVPADENAFPFAAAFRAAGGEIEVIVKPGVDHHPHSLVDPRPIVDFLLAHVH